MKLRSMRFHQSGMALLLVMVTIVALGILAGTFSSAMKVETRLGANMLVEPELEWKARSAIEVVRLWLSDEVDDTPNSDSYVDIWAGGNGQDYEAIIDKLDGLDPKQLLPVGTQVQVVDLERYFNINRADEQILREALLVMGADAADEDTIVNSIQDWMDPDDLPRLSGVESDFYENQFPPYYSKDGPIDDITELLLINGISEEMFWGSGGRSGGPRPVQESALSDFSYEEEDGYRVGLMELFTAISDPSGLISTININTASAQVLDLLPGIDDLIAEDIVAYRRAEEAEDRVAFNSASALQNVPSLSAVGAQQLSQMVVSKSATFRVTVDVEAGGHSARWVGILRRVNPKQIDILSLYRD